MKKSIKRVPVKKIKWPSKRQAVETASASIKREEIHNSDGYVSLEDLYSPAVNMLSGYHSAVSAMSTNINSWMNPANQGNFVGALSGLNTHFNNFERFNTLLPNLDTFSGINKALDFSRNATVAITGLTTHQNLASITQAATHNIKPWLVNELVQPAAIRLTNAFSAIVPETQHLIHNPTYLAQPAINGLIYGAQNALSAVSQLPKMWNAATYGMHTLESTLAVNRASSYSLIKEQPFGFSHSALGSVTGATSAYLSQFQSGIRIPTSDQFSALYQKSYDLTNLVGVAAMSQFSVHANLLKATELTVFAEKNLSSFAWNDLGQNLALTVKRKNLISDSFIGLSYQYQDLYQSFTDNPHSYGQLHPALTRSLPVAYYTGTDVLKVISTPTQKAGYQETVLEEEIVYENEYALASYLPMVHSGLIRIWRGGIQTLNSNSEDKARQFITSLRELFTHILHLLAPDENIREWSQVAIHYANNKPTRKARLLYISRNMTNEKIRKFVDKDIESTISLIDLFQGGTHGIESAFTQGHLLAIKSKAESSLKFILEIEFRYNRGVD